MSDVNAGPIDAEREASLAPDINVEEVGVPKVSLSQVTVGTHMRRLDHREQELVLAMLSRRMAIEENIQAEFSAEQLKVLAEDCEDMAKARIAAEKVTSIVPSGETPYSSAGMPSLTTATIAPTPSTAVPPAWGDFSSLVVLDSSSSSRAQVPKLYTDALKHKIFLPLSMFTYDHLTDVAPNIKTEKFVIPSSLTKIIIPDVKPYLPLEGQMPKAEWDNAWSRFVDAISSACGVQFGKMFQSWYHACKQHSYYQKDDTFPLIQQFDIDKRRLFFAHDPGFVLGKYLLDGADGITSYAANYSIQRQTDLARQNEIAISALANKLSPTRSLPPTSGPDRSPKRNSFRSSSSSFQSSNRPTTASPDCCSRCGRNSHRARDCSESTLADGGDPIICDLRGGRFFTRAGNLERCFRFNAGLACSNSGHTTSGKHKCSLCGNAGHAAPQCSKAE
jgi:hypothetical protein